MFKGYNKANILNEHNSSLYTLLSFNNTGIEYIKYINNETFAINISNDKTDIKVDSDKIDIKVDLDAKVLENNSNLNLKDVNTYNMLNDEFSKDIKNDIIEFIKMLQFEKCDILGFQDIYYKSHNKNNHKLWETADINVLVNLKINYKGFIFEVENEE